VRDSEVLDGRKGFEKCKGLGGRRVKGSVAAEITSAGMASDRHYRLREEATGSLISRVRKANLGGR